MWVITRAINEDFDSICLGVLKHERTFLWEIQTKLSVSDIVTRKNGQVRHTKGHLIGYDDSFRDYMCAKLLGICPIKCTVSFTHTAQLEIWLQA